MEVGEEGDYIPIATLCFINFEGQSHKTVSTDHNFLRERRAEAESNIRIIYVGRPWFNTSGLKDGTSGTLSPIPSFPE